MATPQTIAARDIFPAKVIRQICFEAGADEVGLVEVDRPELAQERKGILQVYPSTQTIISLSRALNRENMQSPARSLANGEFRRAEEELFRISGEILRHLNSQDIRGVTLNPAFPIDMNRWPGKTWDVSHKTLAVEAGLGVMGLKCRLCAAVCPTGAVQKDGAFDFLACATHSYRDLSGGFDWVAALLASQDLGAYRVQFQDRETMGLWQSLLFGFGHKCGYCQAVCPAGEAGTSRYLADKKGYVQQIIKPLKERIEPVYVVGGSQAESRVKSNSHKEIRYAKLARPVQ